MLSEIFFILILFLTSPSQNYFNLGNTKTMTKMLLPSLELTTLIINFLSTNLKIAFKTLQIENFKKHLMIKKYSLLHDNQRT